MSDLDSNVIKTTEQTMRADSDLEENDDNDDEFVDYIRFPSEYENEVQDINLKYSEQGFTACPMFFMGSLKDACQAAFHPTAIQERRPILVYIYHTGSPFQKEFSEIMFNSTAMIDYLNVNYIVCPYETTFESNKYTLMKIWEEMFSVTFFDDFSIEQYPLLIGITRSFEYREDTRITSEYQFITLVQGDTLTRTELLINRENLWNELDLFKEECDRNEQDLSFNFAQKTGLSWKIILDIAQYLSLNDAISTFSMNIYPLLSKTKSKFQLSNPCDPFIKKFFPKINFEQIVSLQFDSSQSWSKTEFTFLSNFKKVISITLYNVLNADQISRYMKCFPELTYLYLYYNNQIEYYMLSNLLDHLQQQVKRFEIHYPGIVCTDKNIDRLRSKYQSKTGIEYFLLNVNYGPLTLINNHHSKCISDFLMPIVDLMRYMPKIRYIHIISNNSNIAHFLDASEWALILNMCPDLKKIRLQVSECPLEKKAFLTKKEPEIQDLLRNTRKKIKYQISFL